MDFFRLVFFSALVTSSSFGENHDQCKPTQYLEVGKTGVIECRFQDGFYSVAWYTPQSFQQKTPLLRLVNGAKIEGNVAPGEFDVRSDGSLIINNVTLNHDHTFTAVKFQSQGDEPITLHAKVVVLVKPPTGYPVVDVCRDESTNCYNRLKTDTAVTCYIADARPPIPLKWVSKTFGREMNISSQISVENHGSLFTSRATTNDTFGHSSLLSLIVCKADTLGPVLSEDESIIFLENESSGLARKTPIVKYVERNCTLTLSCTESSISLIVWKRANRGRNDFDALVYAALFDDSVSRTFSDEYELLDDGKLKLTNTQARHEGLYGCIAETFGTAGDIALFDVSVIVPSSPIVHGCQDQHNCVLNGDVEGTLKCSVTGIRPRVSLQWTTTNRKDLHLIEFFNHQVTTDSKGDVYDIQVTSSYRITPTTRDSVSVECRIVGTNITRIKETAKFDLMINNGQPTAESKTPTKTGLLWFLLILIPLGILALFLAWYLVKRGERRRQNRGRTDRHHEEKIPMFRVSSTQRKYISDKQIQFIFELKTKYQDLYEAVQPIPYIRDRLFCVDKVFVEGGIEYLSARDRTGGQGTWTKLSTYHDIFNDPSVKSTRRIIEGEPGYGKSTLSLQLAYDWCNKIPASSMANTNILIFLQLRQFGGVTSIYTAIKKFLLPKDSKLTESDIEKILDERSSVVVILDGFDEYPDQENSTNSDVISIIGKKMFQQFDVILTTRSSCLPKDYPATTKRIRLTGFDDNARDLYIRKAVVGDDVSAALKIKQKLRENPVLGDLCQVPLLFVMFAHISHENKDFQEFNSVTSFFRYMISCFHSHLQNKMKGENVVAYQYVEQNHEKLDNLAFDGLGGKDQRIVWEKENICGRLGQDFYDHYVRLGILVEEEVLNIGYDQNAFVPEHVKYKTEVGFYHKLFCEWYAAHYLAKYVSRDDVCFQIRSTIDDNEQPNMDKMASTNKDAHQAQANITPKEDHFLKSLDPLDVQYLYRFACGLNSMAAEKIIEYLRSRADASKFVVLCMLEQGKAAKDALEDVRDLCSRDVYIYRHDSMLLQRSTIQLLEIASNNEVTISRLWLGDCYDKVDVSTENVHLQSNLSFPVLNTLKELVIEERGREMTEEEFADVLSYLSKCAELHELRFYDCLLPQTIKQGSILALRSKDVQVFWRPDNQYILNLMSGRWEDEDEREVMTTEQYRQEAEKVRRYRTGETVSELP